MSLPLPWVAKVPQMPELLAALKCTRLDRLQRPGTMSLVHHVVSRGCGACAAQQGAAAPHARQQTGGMPEHGIALAGRCGSGGE